MRHTALLLLLTGCTQAVDVSWRLPAGTTMVVSEERSTITRTPRHLEEIRLRTKSVWVVREPGRAGRDAISWTEEVTVWEVSVEGMGGMWRWNPESEEPLPERLAHLAPPPRRQVWMATDGTATMVVAPQDANAVTEVPRPMAQLPPWLSGLAAAPREPIKPGRSWSWEHTTPVTPANQATTTVTWTFRDMAGSQAILQETLTLEGSPPPARDQYQTTALDGSGELRLDTETGFPISYSESFEANIASPSARGTALRKSEITFEVL